MRKIIGRLALAIIISVSCLFGTITWYQWTMPADTAGSSKPIAELDTTSNEVQRKRSNRLIWQPISKNDELFPGESIRTAANSTAQIKFLAGNTTIHMDPDSVIVLDMSSGKPTLEFVKGYLSVTKSGGDDASSDLTIKAGDKSMSVGDGELVLERAKAGEVSVDVVRGNSSLGQNNRIKPLKPRASETVTLTPDSPGVQFEWAALPPEYTIKLEAGPSRDNLKEVPFTAMGTANKIVAKIGFGSQYWRLIASATDKPNLESPTLPLRVRKVSPPLLAEPVANAQLRWLPESPKVEFKWINPSGLQNLFVEIAKDEKFESLLDRQPANRNGSIALNLPGTGSHYWRVAGSFRTQDGSEVSLMSEARKFDLKQQVEFAPISLTQPEAGFRLRTDAIQKNGLKMEWANVTGVHSYRVVFTPIEEKRAPSDASEAAGTPERPTSSGTSMMSYTPQAIIKTLPPGQYRWSVVGLDHDGNQVTKSESREIAVLDPMILLPPQFAADLPSPLQAAKNGAATIRWMPATGAAEYLVMLKNSTGSIVHESKTPSQTSVFKQLMPGKYEVTVTSLSDIGEASPPSSPLTIVVPEQSQVQPPKLKMIEVE